MTTDEMLAAIQEKTQRDDSDEGYIDHLRATQVRTVLGRPEDFSISKIVDLLKNVVESWHRSTC